ncbi:MAG: 2-oxo acid dehydrogenase subunit E2 [Desulfobacterales bacterium]|jgi:pyruvate dehydrogenase E2 component (dihydrolipoamide acetyltransferase)|nr:2-oxo acid dehydrogenase subunit E2 [Desulfobacterales bacterium]
MATRIIMPQGGQDITEGVVVRWLKREGEAVGRGEVICEVETEKAVFEVECPIEGILLKIAAREGERVPIFATIGIVGSPGEETQIERLLAAEAPGAADAPATRTKACLLPPAARGAKASGRARRLAEEAGIDLSAVAGSGPRGRITEKDVRLAAEDRRLSAAPSPGRPLAPSRMRAAIARRMALSKQSIPHFYVTVSADMTAALALRDRLNHCEGVAVTITDLVVKACALALKAHPHVNCRIRDERIFLLDDIHIGIAVSLEEGVAVPVLAGADRLALVDLSRNAAALIRCSREGRAASTDTAAFTVSNLGMLNVENFIAIINPPETAILAVGSVQKRPVAAADGSLAVREMMTMTLSVDHRAVDGALAAGFVNAVRQGLEHPDRLL